MELINTQNYGGPVKSTIFYGLEKSFNVNKILLYTVCGRVRVCVKDRLNIETKAKQNKTNLHFHTCHLK